MLNNIEDDFYNSSFEPWYWDCKIKFSPNVMSTKRWMKLSGNIYFDFLIYKDNIFTKDLIRYCDISIHETSNTESNSSSLNYYNHEENPQAVNLNLEFNTAIFDKIYELYKTKKDLDFEINIITTTLKNSQGSIYYDTKGIWHLDKDSSLSNIVEGIIFIDILKDKNNEPPENFDINNGVWFKISD